MKATFFKYLCLLSVVLISCEEDVIVYDNVNSQTLAQFTSTSASLPTPESGASVTLNVIVSTISENDRNISVSVDETSTSTPDQYTISGLTIPAGSYDGEITITSNYGALPENGSTELILNLDGISNSDSVVESGVYTLELFRKCPIVLSELVGNWGGTGVWTSIRDYQSRVVTSLNADGELMMTGVLFDWFEDPTFWDEVIITSQPVKVDIDIETGEFVIELQDYVTTTFNGAPQTPYKLRATGKILNACEKTLEIYPVLVQGGSTYNGVNFNGPLFYQSIFLNN